jgi:glutamate-1-semialdehyde 2,1-aminomutase
MEKRDHSKLLAELAEAYTRYAPKSAALNEKAKKHLVDGGSHALRLIEPFPPRIVAAKGARVTDEDGHDILDFWQGHYTNVLGHNAEVVTSVLARAFDGRSGLQTGFNDRLQAETAEILCRQTGADRVRFTTSGALSTMYAILLARTFTGRDLVMKAGGGWHGGQPWGLKGVRFYTNNDDGRGFERVETHGLPSYLTDEVIVTRFNNTDMLRDHVADYGDQLACLIVEPFIGIGGFMPATLEYLQTARQLTQQYGAVLIFDEVIDGFRFRAGDTGTLYGLRPDLATFGKIIGGGMPVAAVAGRADIMDLVGRERGQKVKFSGGTYSAHPASLLAAKTLMTYLATHETEIYPRLADLGEKTRRTMEGAFAEEGIYARCTGYGNNAVRGSSLGMIHFPYQDARLLNTPEDVHDPTVCDVTLREQALKLALLLEGVHVMHGLGALSTAHTEEDIVFLGEACHRVARRFRVHWASR